MPEKFKVSKRIRAIVSEVNTDIMADIACDHAYISIEAVSGSNAGYSIACDINTNSLEKAKKNIYNSGLWEKIETRLANGLMGLKPSEADTVVIAGIGGRLCVEILNFDVNKTKSFKKLILQPQSEPELLRRHLHGMGFKISNENIIIDGGIFYTIITAEPGLDDVYGDFEYLFGKIPIMKKNPALRKYIDLEIKKMNGIIESLPENKKIPDLDKKMEMMKEALKCMQ